MGAAHNRGLSVRHLSVLSCVTGTNEVIEHFPVGRRLAFDAAKGRLWVVCRQCQRWNLSPLDERWEAIEEAERAYRDTKKRMATDHVGLARLRDGTDLIRVGAPLRPEYAAWRYGDTFGRRRRNHLLTTAAVLAGGFGLIAGAKALAIYGIVGPLITPTLMYRRMAHPIAMVPRNDGRLIRMTRYALHTVRISLTWGQDLRLQFDSFDPDRRAPLHTAAGLRERMKGATAVTVDISGTRAERALVNLLPVWNGSVGSSKTVSAAVDEVERHQSIAELIRAAPKIPKPGAFQAATSFGFGLAQQFNGPSRLALEMMLHEESERRALEGELKELEQRWKEAEEIAAISDSLTLPLAATEKIDMLKGRDDRPTDFTGD